jgi:hypothetical protein
MPGGNKPNLANGGIIRQHYHCLNERTRKEHPKEYDPSSKRLPPVVGGAFATKAAALTKTRRRSSAQREFLSSFGARQFVFRKSRYAVARPRPHSARARPLQPRYHRCQWYAAPLCQQRKPPLTTMIDRFAWVVVLAPIRGCGREGWEEESLTAATPPRNNEVGFGGRMR